MEKKGLFMEGSVTGLSYRTDTGSGKLDEYGTFFYQEGDSITFFAGKFPIGSCMAKAFVTPLDFVAEASGRINKVSHFQVTNLCRILLAVGHFDETKESVVGKYLKKSALFLNPAAFEQTPEAQGIINELGLTMPGIAKTHNLLRRTCAGIYKESDVKIPTKSGQYVLGDVYRPLKTGKYPVVMCSGVFGKSFVNGLTFNEEDEAYFEEIEDAFYSSYDRDDTKKALQGAFFKRMGPCFGSARPIPHPDPQGQAPEPSGPPDLLVPVSEVFEQPTAMDWVPYGYVVINLEEVGVGKNRAEYLQFGAGNARNYADCIEWASEQPWSSGKVGLFGASFYAMTQYTAAQYHPKGLTAMIPIMGDYDSYRDYIYSGGGLFNRADNMDPCIPPQDYTFMDHALENPFWSEEAYGPDAKYVCSCDIKKIDYPIWPVTEPDASLHGKGSSEAYINCSSKHKKYTMIHGCGIHFWMYNEQYLSRFRQFFDYWLKGEENGIMDEKPVELQIRTGRGSYYWRREEDWPVPGTEYRRFYLNAENGGLCEQCGPDASVSYSADVMHNETSRVEGATFISEPFTEDVEIAGYIKAGLFVSSTSEDMEIHMNVRVLDEDGDEVIYPAFTSMEPNLPVGFGSMKVSHRVLDPEKSRDDLPVYQHTKEAWAPLVPGEIVEAEVGTFPTSALIRKGWRIRLDIDPVSNRWVCYEEEKYRKDATNSIHTGEGHPSYLQLPVLPKVVPGTMK